MGMNRHDPGRSGRGEAACTPRAGSGRGRPSADGPRAEPSVHRHGCHRRSRQAAPVRNVAGSGGGPGPGVRSVAFHVPARRRCPWTATMAAGACAPGVASSHDVTGHVVWSGNRTHDRRNQDPLLYPTELSSGEPRGIEPRTGEPVPASSRRSRRWHVRDLRHTPRQRRAHQPVVETGPLENRGCRPPTLSRAIMFGCDADNVQALPLARSKSFGGAEKPGSVSGGLPRGVQFWHRGSLCRRKRKRPRDLRSEGVVRPRRSGWPISAGRVSGRCQLVFLAERARQHVHAQAWQQFGDGDGMRVQGKFPVVVETRCAR